MTRVSYECKTSVENENKPDSSYTGRGESEGGGGGRSRGGRGKREWPCCCDTTSLWLLLIVLSATKFESPVCEGGFLGSRFKKRGLGAIEADGRGGAEAGAAGGVGCFDVGIFCEGAGCRLADSKGGISSEATSDAAEGP